jgi:hypothetical protein
MVSTNGVIFPESMADFLSNPVDICFGSMPTTSTTPAACLVIEGNAVTTNQQIKTDLSKKTHPPTPSNLIAGINHVGDMISFDLQYASWLAQCRSHSILLHEAQDPDRIWTLPSKSWKLRESP